MTDQELLARIDERTGVIQRDVVEVKNHLKEINNKTADNGNRIQTLETKIDSHKNWLTGITGGIVAVVLGIIAAFITQLRR